MNTSKMTEKMINELKNSEYLLQFLIELEKASRQSLNSDLKKIKTKKLKYFTLGKIDKTNIYITLLETIEGLLRKNKI